MSNPFSADQVDFVAACASAASRAGAGRFHVGIAAPDPTYETPLIYVAHATDGPSGPGRVTAALTPEGAAFDLMSKFVDGTQCGQCGRTVAVLELEAADTPAEALSRLAALCWWAYDGTVKRFRPACSTLHTVA
jgi:hypothetical protein